MDSAPRGKRRVAVLIPCFNEETTIGKVVRDFRRELPEATVYVYDNNSTDRTVEEARAAGAVVGFEPRRGKGNVVRTMFREVRADVYVMVDGDDTYPAEQVHELMAPVLEGIAHMSTGSRLDRFEDTAFRPLHKMGNRLIRRLINGLFQANLRDILSGYRCFDAFHVRSMPLLSRGFEVETELTLQTLDKAFTIVEVPISYRGRPEGSYSKLNTYLDGLLVISTIFRVFKDYKPLRFFSYAGLLALLAGLGLGLIPVVEFVQTRVVRHVPTAILATGLMLVALLSFATGIILDTLNRRQLEQYHLQINLMEWVRRNLRSLEERP